MPPHLILALVGAVLALLATGQNEENLKEQERKELEELQNQLAQARKTLRHAQNAKKRFIARTGAREETESTEWYAKYDFHFVL